MKKYLILIIIMLGFGIWSLGFENAEAFSLSIDPPHVNIDVAPGQASTGYIRVENLDSDPIKVEAFTEDWTYISDGSKNFVPAGSTKLSCSKWIKLDPVNFDIEPKTSKMVKYTIAVPKESIGGHYSVIFFKSSLGAGQYKGQTVGLAGRIGTIVYQSSGKIIKYGLIENVSIKKDEKTKETFINVTFRNRGNVYLSAKGKVSILDKSGNVLDTISVENLNTIPGDVMTKKIKYEKALPQGIYTLDAEINYGGSAPAKLDKIVLYKSMILAEKE